MTDQKNIDHQKEIVNLLRQGAYRHDRYQVFSDCMAVIALAISNSVDLAHRDEREQRYLRLVSRYEREELEAFAHVMAHVAMALEDEPSDVLGQALQALDLHNKDRGQFLTPHDLSKLIAQIQAEDAADQVKQQGFITALEPAVGSGAMVIALAESMRARGLNYQQQLHVTAVDLDERAVHMAYVQFSLLHIPAQVIVGDSLTGEAYEHWFTPAHVLGGWSRKLRHRNERGTPEAGAWAS